MYGTLTVQYCEPKCLKVGVKNKKKSVFAIEAGWGGLMGRKLGALLEGIGHW